MLQNSVAERLAPPTSWYAGGPAGISVTGGVGPGGVAVQISAADSAASAQREGAVTRVSSCCRRLGRPVVLAVWDGGPSSGHGGTADVVDAARERGLPVTIVWPDGAERE
ncbi:hypothetical protein L3Q67_02325 [Saccharothrix sp. AJ9571]|nr:hypothetical protein L3Q67_02325 [Saccharothrix sp. AJ9571]